MCILSQAVWIYFYIHILQTIRSKNSKPFLFHVESYCVFSLWLEEGQCSLLTFFCIFFINYLQKGSLELSCFFHLIYILHFINQHQQPSSFAVCG